MYGLILEGIAEAIRRKFGDETWQEIKKKAGVKHDTFNNHKTYSETVIPRIAKAGSEVSGKPVDELMELCGYTFVPFSVQFGYDRVMRVLGRHLRDFLNGLDNLHEYLRFSYPKLKPPSFFCENETRHGLTLNYRSKRRGFLYYVMGMVTQVAKFFYNTNIEIELLSEDESMDLTHVVMKLHFDNTGFKDGTEKVKRDIASMPVNSDMFFNIFPFHIVFSSGLTIKSIGTGLAAVMPHIIGQSVDEMFQLTRPLLEFNMENVTSHLNNVFELMSVDGVKKTKQTGTAGTEGTKDEDEDEDDEEAQARRRLKLKGQILYMEDWDAALFLGTPVMGNLDKMFDIGLYINDLSMHDSSRDLVLASTQQECELKMALDVEAHKTEIMKATNERMKVVDGKNASLLGIYNPRLTTQAMLEGTQAADLAAAYDKVGILYADICGFLGIMDKVQPSDITLMLNTMYQKFDAIVDKNKIYRVHSTGQAYVAIAGAPVATRFAGVYVLDTSLDLLTACAAIKNPAGDEFAIRIGCHIGSVTCGVVGYRFPRFYVFGDDYLIARDLCQAGERGKISVSEKLQGEVQNYAFTFEGGNAVDVKGGANVKTFLLTGRGGGASLIGTLDETAPVGGMVTGFLDDKLVAPAWKAEQYVIAVQ